MKRFNLRRPAAILTTLLLALSLGGATASGQNTSSGTVTGAVTDSTGALLPGATITMTDVATKAQLTAVSNKTGQFIIQDVPPSTYTITSTKTGFATDQIVALPVSVGTQTTANFTMAVGAESTTIEVQATNADLQTLNATIGATVNPLSIQSLPSIGRDVATFATLQPGVTPGGSVAGTVADQAVFTLDGGSNSSDMDGSMLSYTGSSAGSTATTIGSGPSGVIPMPQDSVEEFKVATAGQTADFNNSSGSQVQVVTKRGTNTVHGTVYEYYLDNNFNGNTWQNRLTGTAKPSYHYSRFGAAAGGPISPYVLGGKTYLFGLYEGYRFPNSATYERSVPSPLMRQGIVQFNNAAGVLTQYNLKQYDPRGIGISPTVAALFAQLPAGNDPGCSTVGVGARCDTVNTIGFRGNVALPEKQNTYVTRLDHDFGSKWKFNTSYRYYKRTRAVTNQVDIGGVLPGDKMGVPTSTQTRPQQPWFYVAGLTTNITTNVTNDFHYSYLRNYWSYNEPNGAPPSLPGLGGVLEPFGEYSTTSLTPYNVDTQDVRTRIWDGHDHFMSDNVTWLKGNHLIQVGGQYEHDFAFHNRTDNGGGINYTTTYQLGDSSGGGLVGLSGLAAAGVPTSSTTNARIIDAVLGIVTDSQVAYTRTGSNLALNPPLTPAFDQATIPFYNIYLTDTWRAKPNLTFNFGVGYAIEMPPLEKTGKQVALVDANNIPIKTSNYLAARQSAAMAGQVYNPQIGFALVGNTANGGLKYPYNPYYGSISPRLSVAFNPHFEHDTMAGHLFGESGTVIRGGYGRVFGRLNGVGLVLTPLLGPGLIQGVQCRTALSNGTCASTNPTDSTAFRIGVDGLVAPLAAVAPNLPQPFFPGYNGAATATASVLDPTFRPNAVDSFNLTVQRQLGHKMLLEVGYIGRVIRHEFEPLNINSVPYMMGLGGQTFAAAYANIESSFGCTTSSGLCRATTNAATAKAAVYPSVSPQPFFETALAGTGYCTGYANCTQAVVRKETSHIGNQQVFNLWSDLDAGGFNFPRTMMGTAIPGQANGANGQIGSGVSLATATGYGNYNGGFVSFKATDYHGLTLVSNFTYSKALGVNAVTQASSSLTANDAFDLAKNYGVQAFNQKFITNTFLVYQTPWFKQQSSLLGRLAGGFTISPIFTAGSGQPIPCTTNSTSQSFGSADALNFSDTENCIFTQGYQGAKHGYRGVTGGNDPNNIAVGTSVASTAGDGHGAVNIFQNPAAIYNSTRPAILGLDESVGGDGPISGLPYFNLDVSVRKNVRVFERVSLEFSGIILNVLNHNDFSSPNLTIATPASFGVITTQGNTPRQIQAGARVSF